MSQHHPSVLEAAIRRGGVLKGAQAATVITHWAVAEKMLGHRLGTDHTGSLSAAVREYARYWKVHERTAWRDIRRFKAVFPEYESPAPLAALVADATDLAAAHASLASIQLA